MPVILVLSLFIILLGLSLIISPKRKSPAHNSFSIIIPCRNEIHNLPTLFHSLDKLDYEKDLYEIILIDDASQDDTPKQIREYCENKPNYQSIIIEQKSADYKGKKYALKRGIEKAKFENLLFTDADCIVPTNWIDSFNKYLSNDIGMIVGYSPEKNVSTFRRFSQIITADFYCATINLGVPFSNNGRNLYINKDAYDHVDGFEKIRDITCGEDKLLLNLIKNTNYRIIYNSDCKVFTHPQVQDYVNQQKRRYGQFSLSSPLYKVVSLIIFLFFLYLPFHIIFYRDWLGPAIYYISFLFFWIVGLIKHKEIFCIFDLFYIIVYPYYLIYYSLIGMFSKWTWK
ncbi:MAG: glycosyltransferase [Candidatus Cloacimonetes bacterium]|nr:glycosyltransferase [Candidatus Cloacimonadota bacterium]